jgi:hypothetical protein
MDEMRQKEHLKHYFGHAFQADALSEWRKLTKMYKYRDIQDCRMTVHERHEPFE